MLKLEKEKLTNTSNHCSHCKESSLAVDDRGICRDRMMYKNMCSVKRLLIFCINFGMHFHLRMVLWAEVAVGVVVMVEEGLMIAVLVEDGAEEASVMAEILMIPLHMVFHQTNAVLLSEKV